MSFQVQPLDMITAPNYFAPIDQWLVTDPNAASLWMTLEIVDALGARRYIAAPGATLQMTFQRRDSLQQQLTNPFYPAGTLTQSSQSVIINASVNGSDASMWNATLNSAQISTIVSGTVLFQLTEGSAVTQWSQNYLVAKKMTKAGW